MAAAAATSEKDTKAFKELCKMKYVDQAKWYLNGFWGSVEKEAESVWKWTQKMQEYDSKQKKNGSSLDEFMAHKFLESLGETLTVVELRAKLRKIDLDADGKMALLEYCIFRFNTTVTACVNNPQGGGPEHKKQMDEAAALMESLNSALSALITKLAEQKVLEANQRKALSEQNKALAAQEAAMREVKKAEDELRKAVDELHAQEKAYKDACDSLDAKAKDEKLPAMKRSMASNELAQLKSKDPLPLNKAKITQGAALKRVEAQKKLAAAATDKCAEQTKVLEAQTREVEKKAAAATAEREKLELIAKELAAQTIVVEAKTKEVEEQTRATEAKTAEVEEQTRQLDAKNKEVAAQTIVVEEQTRKCAEQTLKVEADQKATEAKAKVAHEALEELKKKGGVQHGSLWWMEREVVEAQKYLPKSKQTKLQPK